MEVICVNNIVNIMKHEIISRSNKFEKETKRTKDEYNLWLEHVQYVYKYARMIAKEKDVDIEVVELSALLHDILMTDSSLNRANHNEYGSIIAEELLRKNGYPEDKIILVKKCILNHSSKRKEFRNTAEEEILVNADAMAYFDSIGSIYSLASKVIGLSEEESIKYVKEKLTKDYNEISDEVKKHVESKYNKIMNSTNYAELIACDYGVKESLVANLKS